MTPTPDTPVTVAPTTEGLIRAYGVATRAYARWQMTSVSDTRRNSNVDYDEEYDRRQAEMDRARATLAARCAELERRLLQAKRGFIPDQICSALKDWGDGPWRCTLPVGHEGNHEAHAEPDNTDLIASWRRAALSAPESPAELLSKTKQFDHEYVPDPGSSNNAVGEFSQTLASRCAELERQFAAAIDLADENDGHAKRHAANENQLRAELAAACDASQTLRDLEAAERELERERNAIIAYRSSTDKTISDLRSRLARVERENAQLDTDLFAASTSVARCARLQAENERLREAVESVCSSLHIDIRSRAKLRAALSSPASPAETTSAPEVRTWTCPHCDTTIELRDDFNVEYHRPGCIMLSPSRRPENT